jgi:hypothetical protein
LTGTYNLLEGEFKDYRYMYRMLHKMDHCYFTLGILYNGLPDEQNASKGHMGVSLNMLDG